MQKAFFTLFFLCTCLQLLAQNARIDSLLQIADTASPEAKASVYIRIGVEYFYSGDYDKALEYYLKNLQIHEQLGNEEKRAMALSKIASVYTYMKEYEKALDYHQDALEVFEKLGNDTLNARALNNIGITYGFMGMYEKSVLYFERALSFNRNNDQREGLTRNLLNLGVSYQYLEKYEKANEYFFEALLLAKSQETKAGISNCYVNLGKNYLDNRQYETANKYLDSALVLSEETGLKYITLGAYEAKYILFQKKDNHQKALEYYMLYRDLRDSISGEETKLKIADLQLNYETAKKEKEIAVLSKEKEIDRIEISKQKGFIWFSVSLLALTFTLLIILFRHYKLRQRLHVWEKQQLNTEIENNRWKLSSTALHLAEKNKLLTELTKQLDNIKTNEGNREIQRIKKVISKTINLDDDWQAFLMHFDNVHPGFFKKLKTTYPHLTANDEKLCAYIRMKLSTKEIAQLMNITPESVKRTKMRLRKKLALHPDVTLPDFIFSY